MSNMNNLMKYAIMLVVALIIVATVLPIGLIYIGTAENATATVSGTEYALGDVIDPAVLTLLTIVLPILVVVGIIAYFIPRFYGKS